MNRSARDQCRVGTLPSAVAPGQVTHFCALVVVNPALPRSVLMCLLGITLTLSQPTSRPALRVRTIAGCDRLSVVIWTSLSLLRAEIARRSRRPWLLFLSQRSGCKLLGVFAPHRSSTRSDR